MTWGNVYCRLWYRSKDPPRPVPSPSKPKRIYNRTQHNDRDSRCHVVFLSRFDFFHPRKSCFCCVSIEVLDVNAIFVIKFGYCKFFLYIMLNIKIFYMPIIVPFPVYGLLFGIQYVAGDMDENFDLDDDVQMVQIALGFFGLSIMW